MTDAEHLELLKDAIAANLRARRQHAERKRKAAAKNPQPIVIHWIDMANFDATKSKLDDIVKDPVVHALRAQMKQLGKQLFRLVGSTKAMGDVAEEVASRQKNWGVDINIIDKNWDGIGEGNDWWWA